MATTDFNVNGTVNHRSFSINRKGNVVTSRLEVDFENSAPEAANSLREAIEAKFPENGHERLLWVNSIDNDPLNYINIYVVISKADYDIYLDKWKEFQPEQD